MLDVSRLHSQFEATTSSHGADCSLDPLSRKRNLPRQWHMLGNGVHPTRCAHVTFPATRVYSLAHVLY